MRHPLSPARLVLAIALGAFSLGSRGCGPDEDPEPPPPDPSAQIRVLAAGGPQEECEQAVRELEAMGPDVVPRIAETLRGLPPETDGSWLGEALFTFGEDAAPAGEAILSRLVLGSNTAHVMASVLAVSGEAGQRLLAKALEPGQPEPCLVAALIKVEADSDAAVQAIGRLTDHESSDVREEALLRLSESGRRGRPHLPGIRKAFEDESDSVREAAVQAAASVGARGDSATADALGELLLRESESSVMRAAIAALVSLGAGTPTVHRALQHATGQGEEEVKSEATAALRKLFSD